MTNETPTVRFKRPPLDRVVATKVDAEDLGLPTLEECPTSYSRDPDEDERISANPALGPLDEALKKYFESTRAKKFREAEEELPPETLRKPRLSVCMAVVSVMRR